MMINSFAQRLGRRLAARRLRLGPSIMQTQFLGCQMLVRPQEDVGRSMALGEFETDDLQHFLGSVRDGDVVFDVGANVGAYCVPIGKAFPATTVYAFEPIELNAALIQVSALANGVRGVRVVRQCVSDTSGTVELSLAEDSAYSSMIDTRRKSEVAKVTCAATSLDDFCSAQGCRPDVVKIDVEGAELKVLQGASSVFGSAAVRPRLVLIELYNQNLQVFGTSIDEVTARMTDLGYRPYILIDGAEVAFERAHHNHFYNVFFKP
jgi:FkbM family methyltransferase